MNRKIFVAEATATKIATTTTENIADATVAGKVKATAIVAADKFYSLGVTIFFKP